MKRIKQKYNKGGKVVGHSDGVPIISNASFSFLIFHVFQTKYITAGTDLISSQLLTTLQIPQYMHV
jgi:hypothetical protein